MRRYVSVWRSGFSVRFLVCALGCWAVSTGAALPEFFLDARTGLSGSVGHTHNTLPREYTYYDDWSLNGQDQFKRDVLSRQRFPGRIEGHAFSCWLQYTFSSIGSEFVGRFKSTVRFEDLQDPQGNGTLSTSLNIHIDGRIYFACLSKILLQVRLNGQLQEGEYALNSALTTTSATGLLAGLTGTDEFSGETPSGRQFDQIVVTAPVEVPLNQDVELEVEVEIKSLAKGTGVCSYAFGRFENGVGLPFNQDVFNNVPAHVRVHSEDLFLQNNRWGPVLDVEPGSGDVVIKWPGVVSTNMVLQSAAPDVLPLEWTDVPGEPGTDGSLFQLTVPRSNTFRIFRLREP